MIVKIKQKISKIIEMKGGKKCPRKQNKKRPKHEEKKSKMEG